jgi:hypothetical protein
LSPWRGTSRTSIAGSSALYACAANAKAAVYGDGGDDNIIISTTARALEVNGSYGYAEAVVDGGDGKDFISISSTGTGGTLYAETKIATASVHGGKDNDDITITGKKDVLYASGSTTVAVYGDEGNDIITVNGNIKTESSGRAEINGGSGNDKITFNGTIAGSNILIDGGDDIDTLCFKYRQVNNIVSNKASINGFEHLIVNLESSTATLDNLLGNLSELIDLSYDGENTLIINGSADSEVTLTNTDLLASRNDVYEMAGYNAYIYTNNTHDYPPDDVVVYIKLEIDNISCG